jgi:hypothetical protein
MADIKFQMTGEISDAARSMAEFIRLQEKVDAEFDQMSKSAGKADRAVKKIGSKKKDIKGVNDEVGGFNKAAGTAATRATNWIKGFVGISLVVKSIQMMVSELQKASEIQKNMLGIAVDWEKETMKVAHLRGDVSESGVRAAQKDVADLAKKAGVSLEVASQIQFYSESALGSGTDVARTGAANIAGFAAAANLTPEEVKQIPKLFSVMRAGTDEEQKKILNQLYEATRQSIAESGEYIKPFISTAVGDVERGFTLSQSLARMTAAIETTGSVEEAATMSGRLADIAAGRTKKGLEFMTTEAGMRGLDYAGMTDPQRLEFSRRLYGEFKGEGNMDVLKTQLDVKGFSAMRALFSDVGQEKYAAVLAGVRAAEERDTVERMAEQYKSSLTGMKTLQDVNVQIDKARSGRTAFASAMLEEQVKALEEQFYAQADVRNKFASSLWNTVTFGTGVRGIARESLITKGLSAAHEEALRSGDTQAIEDIEAMQAQGMGVLKSTESIDEFMRLTDNLNAMRRVNRANSASKEDMAAMTAALKENTEELRRKNMTPAVE